MRFLLSAHRSTVLVGTLVILAFVPVLSGRQGAKPVDEAIKKVQAQFAPDTRVAVFDVKAETKGDTVELTGDVDQTAAKEAVLMAVKNAGSQNVVDKIAVLPAPEFAEQPYAVVTVSVAVMKTKASHASELGNQLIMGMPVKLLKRDGWYYVQALDDHYLGWMESDHLAMMTKAQLDSFQAAPRVIVTSLFAVVRSHADVAAAPVSDLVVGNVLRRTGESGAFYAVELPDGRKGFVGRTDATDYQAWKGSRKLTPENIEQSARQFMGVPYLWGGTSAKGFDCSGFVKTAFRLNGLELQRDADQQSNEGTAVPTDGDLAQLKKGDVLFFGPRPGVTRITHTGIYLGGKLFIHCSGFVKLNSFDPAAANYSENLLKRLVKVRRFAS
jgi:gamma-D-glutamyl-L-lysine dipeptidyl-peptidase